MSKKILVISDTHDGSTKGISLPEYISAHLKPISHCEELLNRFWEVRDWAGKVDYLFHLGDGCDGWNPKQRGEGRTTEEKYQVEGLTKIIKTVKGSPKIIWIKGSHYHVGQAVGHLDERVAENVGALPDRYGNFARTMTDIQIEDIVFNLCHKVSRTRSVWVYQLTPIGRLMAVAKLNDRPNTITLRGHAHTYAYAGFTNSMGMICPSFELNTEFLEEQGDLSEPRIGGVVINVDKDRFDWDIKIWKPKVWVEVIK